MMRRLLATVAVAALFLCPDTSAQSVNAIVSGTVTDVTGALLPAVTVTATNTETGVITTTQTNETGMYNFPSLQPGIYEVSASLPGFLTQPYKDLEFNAQPYLIRFTLPLASVITPGVEVQAMSMDAMMAASSQSAGFLLSEKMARDLPTAGNDALSFVRMFSGVNAEGGGGMMMSSSSLFTFAGVPQISVNTTRDGVSVSDTRYNTGVNANTLINPDLVGEIRLILAPVDAELGRGNAQVQIQTRSGTNRYAGSTVWSIRNSALDPNTWANNNRIDPITGQWSPASPNWVNNHQYTVSFGGPIVKNKTFFFALWDQQFNNQRQLVTASVMTNTARQGIFRYFQGWNPGNVLTATNPGGTNPIIASVDVAGNPVAPLTNPNGTTYTGGLRCFSVFGNVKSDGTPFGSPDCPGGTALTSAAAWDPLRPTADPTGYIRKILDRMPAPNYFGLGDGLNLAGFQWVRRQQGNSDIGALAGTDPLTPRKQINLKIDENFNANHRLSVSWSHERNDTVDNSGFWPDQLSYEVKRYPQVLTANFTSALLPHLLNEARFGFLRQNRDMSAPWEAEESREEAMRYTIPGSNGYLALISPGAGNYGFGGTDNGVIDLAPDSYGGGLGIVYTYADMVSWTVRKHALKVGAEFRFSSANGYGQPASPAFQYPSVSGGPGGNTSPLSGQIAGLPNLLATSRTNVSNMLYFLSGSVNSAAMGYWIDNPSDVADGKWADTLTKGRNYLDYRQNEWAAFWKDDWKVTHNLTLNLGLRYEYYGSPYAASGARTTTVDQGDGLWGVFRSGGENPFERWLSPGNVYLTGYGPNVSVENALKCAPPGCDPNNLTTIEFVGPNSPNPRKRLIPADRNNFGPAVGFAWRLPWFGEGKTTVRGGYQITYGGSFGATGLPAVSLTSPPRAPGWFSSATTNLSEFSGQYLDLRSVPLLVPVRPSSEKPGNQTDVFASSGVLSVYDARYTTPYVQNFNLSVTRTLLPNLSLELRYVGTVSKKQASSINLNTTNVYHNKELFEALEITRAGGNAPVFDQMFAGLNLNNGVAGYGPVGTLVNGILQTGSAHLRRNGNTATTLARGTFTDVALFLNGNGSNMPAVGATGGLLALPAGLTGVGARLLRNGCDRLAAGQTSVGTSNPAPLRCFPENYIRANPQYGNSFLSTNSASSNYHSMQAQIMLRPTRGFTYMGTYTWSKNLGVPGYTPAVTGVTFPDYTDPTDRRGDYTYTDSHRAHDFRSSGTFELPAGPGRLLLGNSSGWLAQLAGGWQSSIILTMTSGARADIIARRGLYENAGVPDIVRPLSSHPQGHVRWNGNSGSFFGPDTFIKVTDPQCAGVTTADNLRNSCNLTALAIRNADGSAGPIFLQNSKPGTRGSLGQRTIELPGTWSFDANLAKTFRITESGWIKSLQLRVDATNVLNHPSPGLPDRNILSSSPFGIITTKDGGRAFQGQVRVNF